MTSFNKMLPEGKTSTLQDIEAGRKTEVEIFAGTIIELGKKYNIPTPYNMVMKDMIEILENKNQM
jgi:2-dehydropantoate 2-reductase